MRKVFLVFVLGVCFMGMSAQKRVSGKLAMVGNEPFSYYIINCSDGKRLRLEGKSPQWIQLQGRLVELVYLKTDKKEFFPVVKVIELKAK